MKPIIVILSLLLLFSNSAFAEEYGVYDPQKILTVTETNAENKYGLDLKYLVQSVAQIIEATKNGTIQFKSK
ncbi:hypothetical protein [Rheinheimera baltica]|uniref:hypothetical protein n=1 Tax=Rheinheimera baltica TaxID=67576 RepID=UPI00273DA4A4|nr:hypothetical protein [Rheinheimera baltica]MDP5189287.1 hypothetical protein [Rheinheimera baltica]